MPNNNPFAEGNQNPYAQPEHRALLAARNTKLKVNADLLDNPDVAALITRVEPHADRVRSIPSRLQKLAADQFTELRGVQFNKDLSDTGRASKAKQIRQRAADEIAAMQAEMEASTEGINTALAKSLRKPEVSETGQVLAELRASRLTHKVQQQLSAVAGDPAKFQAMVERLAKNTPEAELPALADQIREQTEGGSLAPLSGPVLQTVLIPRIEAALPPTNQAALQIERDCQSGISRVAASLAAMKDARNKTIAIAGFEAGEVLQIASGV